MSAANPVASSGSVIYQMNTYLRVQEKSFFDQFKDVKTIATDEHTYSTDKSITSFEIGDCITIFAIEKKNGNIQGIVGFHFADSSDDEEMQEVFEDYTNTGCRYELYIIGGNEATTSGAGCLLANIRASIDGFFGNNAVIKQELLDLNSGKPYQYISANLQMDGTLTYCHHN